MTFSTQPVLLEECSLSEGQIIADSMTRNWRANCKSGLFTIGSNTVFGPKLSFELVSAEILDQVELFNYPRQKWLALLIVDEQSALGTMLLKGESLEAFFELKRSALFNNESLLSKRIQATMERRTSSSGNSYYSVSFQIIAPGTFTAAIAELRQQQICSPQIFRQLQAPTRSEPETDEEVEINPVVASRGNGKKRPTTTSATAH